MYVTIKHLSNTLCRVDFELVSSFAKDCIPLWSARVSFNCFVFEGDFTASDITMPEQDRLQLLVMVKQGSISVDDVIDVVSCDVKHDILFNFSGY